MVTHTFVNIDLIEAEYLADLDGIEYDLTSTISLCEELKKVIENEDYASTMIDTLSTTISVRYSRPFASGVRKKIDIKNIATIPEELIQEHERILAIRNKYVAHSVNAFEESQVVGYYIKECPKEKGITSVSVQHGRVMGFTYRDAESIIKIATLVLRYVNDEITKERAKILRLVREIDVMDFLNSASKKVPMLSSSDPRKKRNRR